MKLEFSIVAEREIEAAADYYENEEAGLGFQFVEELNHAIAFVLQFPNAWSPLSKRSRRCSLRRFPYNVRRIRPENLDLSAAKITMLAMFEVGPGSELSQ
jgi:hypothetical protein